MQWLDTAKAWVLKFIDIGNIMKFIAAFGGQGLVGLVAIGVVLYILNRR
jgi:hypothetical protein